MKKKILVIAWSLFLVSCMKKETAGPGPETAGIEDIQWYLTEVAGSVWLWK